MVSSSDPTSLNRFWAAFERFIDELRAADERGDDIELLDIAADELARAAIVAHESGEKLLAAIDVEEICEKLRERRRRRMARAS